VTEFRSGLTAELVAGVTEDWREVTVREPDWWWFNVERYSVETEREKWTDDLGFFRSWLAVVKPGVNARWVQEYFERVRTVYTFRCSTSAPETNMDLVNRIVRSLRDEEESGLLYAELEGWMNERGAHVTWEVKGQVSGACLMAIRRPRSWIYFRVDLSDPEQVQEFQTGEVPMGLETKEYAD
jgi:hypothetical protein